MSFTLVPQMRQNWAWDKGTPPPWEEFFGLLGLLGLGIQGLGTLGINSMGTLGVDI